MSSAPSDLMNQCLYLLREDTSKISSNLAGDQIKTKEISDRERRIIKTLELLLQENSEARTEFFSLQPYLIRKLVLAGVSLEVVRVASNAEKSRITGQGPTIEDSAPQLEKLMNGLFAGIQGQQDRDKTLHGERLRIVKHGLTPGYIAQDLRGRIGRVFTEFTTTFKNFWNGKIFESQKQLATAKKAVREFKKVITQTSESIEAKCVLFDLLEALKDPDAQDAEMGLYLDPDTGVFVWREAPYEDSLEDHETAQTVMWAINELNKVKEFSLKTPDGIISLSTVLKRFRETPWGEAYVKQQNSILQTKFEDQIDKQVILKFDDPEDLKKLVEIHQSLKSERDEMTKFVLIRDSLRDPELGVNIKKQLLEWLIEYIEDPRFVMHRANKLQLVFTMNSIEEVRELDPLRSRLTHLLETKLPQTPSPEPENYKSNENITLLKTSMETFLRRFGRISVRGFSTAEHKNEYIKMLKDFVTTLDEVRPLTLLTEDAETLYLIGSQLYKFYQDYSPSLSEAEKNDVDGPFKVMLAKIVSFSPSIYVPRKGVVPSEIANAVTKDHILSKTYEESLKTTTTLLNKMPKMTELITLMLSFPTTQKDRAVLIQAKADIEMLQEAIQFLANSLPLPNEAGVTLPTGQELKQIEFAIGKLQEDVYPIGRLCVFSEIVTDIEKKIKENDPDLRYRAFLDANTAQLSLLGHTTQALWIRLAQFLPQFRLGITQAQENEISDARKEVLTSAGATLHEKVVLMVNQHVIPLAKTGVEFLSAADLYSAKDLDPNEPARKLRKELLSIYELMTDISPDEKLHLQDEGLVRQNRTPSPVFKRAPRKSRIALTHILDKLQSAADLNIWQLAEGITLTNIVECMSENGWVTDVMGSTPGLKTRFDLLVNIIKYSPNAEI